MQIFNPDFGLFFLILFLITLISFLTGGILSRFVYVGESKYFRVFFNLLIGYLFWIFLTAIFFTKGNTIFVILPISFIAWRLIFRQNLGSNKYAFETFLKDIKILLKESWFLLFIFLLFIIKHIVAKGDIEHDSLFYSNVAYAMTQSGVEGVNFGMFSSYVVKPYHYSDIWIISLISQVFKTNYYHTVIFISVPFLLFITYSGAMELVKEVGRRFYNGADFKYIYIFAGIIFVIGGLDYPFLREHIGGTTGLIQFPKTSIIYIMFIISLIFVLRNQFLLAFFSILLLPTLYMQTIFFVMPATGILILFSLINNFKVGVKLLLLYTIVVGSMFLFYFINLASSDELSPIGYSQNMILEGFSVFPIQFIKKMMRLSIVYFPFLLLFVISINRGDLLLSLKRLKTSQLFLIIVIFLFSGFFFSLLFSAGLSLVEYDYLQVYFIGLFPLLAILSFMTVIFTLYEISISKNHKYNYIRTILLAIIFVGLFLQQRRDPRYWGHVITKNVDQGFYNKLAETLKDEDKIATFQNFEAPEAVDWPQFNYQLYPNLSRIANFRNNGIYIPECINVHEMDTVELEHRKYHYQKSSFLIFLDSLKKEKVHVTFSEAQYLFLKKYEFNHLIVPDNFKIPAEVQTLVIDSISRNDGLRIYKLKTDL